MRLLKLGEVDDSEFYQTLGLETGDVIMRVNGEWIHEFQNNLFDELHSKDVVSLVLMRKGYPVHNLYRVSTADD